MANYDLTYEGPKVQDILDAGNTLEADGYIFCGVATPSTNPGTPTEKVYYEAKESGTYTNFGGAVLSAGLHLLIWNGSSWSTQTFFMVDDVPTAGSENLVKSGGTWAGINRVYSNALKNSDGDLDEINMSVDFTVGLIFSNGNIETSQTTFRTSPYISIDGFSSLYYKYIFPRINSRGGLVFYNSNKEYVTTLGPTGMNAYNEGTINLSDLPDTAKYVRFSSAFGISEEEFSQVKIVLKNADVTRVITFEELASAIDKVKFNNGVNGDIEADVQTLINSEAYTTGQSIWTTKDSGAISAGYLNTISLVTRTTGRITFYVGLIDQYSNMVNERSFAVDVPSAGHCTINVSSQKIYIEQGEQLFIEPNDVISIKWYKPSSVFPHEAMSAPVNGIGFKTFEEQSSTVFPNGVVIGLNWTILSYDGFFALDESVKQVNNSIQQIRSQINTNGIVYDNQGNPYKIIVSNGQLVPKSMNYSKVVALGNSLTCHPYKADIGWLTTGYSMASTRKETSWTEQLEKILKERNNDAEVLAYNINQWELNPAIEPSTITYNDGVSQTNINISDILTSDVDCVIFRAGENNATTPQTQQDYENGLTALVNYIKQCCPLADIIICSLMWKNAMKDAAFQNVANNLGLKYVDCENSGYIRETLGDYCLSYDGTTYFPIVHSGVAQHVSDYGFYVFANILATALGMQQLTESFTIDVESNADYILNHNDAVQGGVITIQTFGINQPTIAVTDGNGDSVEVVNRNMSGVVWKNTPSRVPTWCSTFIMPDSNVNVEIS